MIRRHDLDPRGAPGWALISQLEHARIAGELATDWGRTPFAPLVRPETLLPTIFRHDAGWADWELHPSVDPATGLPRQFTEMPLVESLPIWQRSIDALAELGPLAQDLVSGHFSALLRHSNQWQRSSHPQVAEAADFLARQDADRARWHEAWQGDELAAVLALEQLQFFDRFSLGLCCAPISEALTLPTPDGPPLVIIPLSSSTFEVTPWPWRVPQKTLRAAGRWFPEGRYLPAEVEPDRGIAWRRIWTLQPSESARTS